MLLIHSWPTFLLCNHPTIYTRTLYSNTIPTYHVFLQCIPRKYHTWLSRQFGRYVCSLFQACYNPGQAPSYKAPGDEKWKYRFSLTLFLLNSSHPTSQPIFHSSSSSATQRNMSKCEVWFCVSSTHLGPALGIKLIGIVQM